MLIPIYLHDMRVPFEWMALPGCLLPAVRFAIDGALAADLLPDENALLGWRLPEAIAIMDAAAALSGMVTCGGARVKVDAFVSAFDAALAAAGLSGVPDDLFFRIGLSFLHIEHSWEPVSPHGGIFCNVERTGGWWESNFPW
ncbi:hypothetical protein TSH64_17080 [Azospirillum sp. TSH64]|nr:hypothetical protein TSH64_17080 [Azospirillum sp. TSH64]